MKHINIIFILMIFISGAIDAQEERIKLSNPSFEDRPMHSRAPMGWYDCGMDGESPPDVQPGVFEVWNKAHEGNTYLGMVTRDNETWEAVGQRLSSPVLAGNCYQFNIYLTYSDEYFSISKTTLKEEFFIKPIVFRVWGGNGYCDKRELLSESGLVKSTQWEEHQFILKPKRDYKYIVFEAFYKTPAIFPYNGNILVDNASDIVLRGKCEEDEPTWIASIMEDDKGPIASNDRPPSNINKPPPSNNNNNNNSNNDKPVFIEPTPEPDPQVLTPVKADPKSEPVIMEELANPANIKEGQSIRIEQLDFDADAAEISDKMHPVLDEIYQFMIENPKVIIEIGGHTNGLPSHEYCNWLSKNRASAVTDYLVSQGLDNSRISFKGYGKTLPIDTNGTASGRKKNQRVEIKILSLKG